MFAQDVTETEQDIIDKRVALQQRQVNLFLTGFQSKKKRKKKLTLPYGSMQSSRDVNANESHKKFELCLSLYRMKRLKRRSKIVRMMRYKIDIIYI